MPMYSREDGVQIDTMSGQSFADRVAARWVLVLALIMIAGIGMRWAIIHNDHRDGPWGDEWQYEAIGRNLAEGHGYSVYNRPTALRVPVTPLLVAAIYAVGKHDLVRARIVWSVLDILTCLLIFRLTLLIGGTRLAGLIAAAVYSLNPYFAFLGSHVMSETPFTFLFLASLVLFVLYWRTKSWWSLCLSGIVLALSTLARPTGFLYPAVIVCLLFLVGRRHRAPWLAQSAVYLLMVGLTMLPWVIRNGVALKSFVPLSTYGGATLWCGSGAGPNGELIIGPWCDKTIKATMDRLSEVDADRYLKRQALAAIRERPVHWLHLGLIKFVRLWFRVLKPGWTSPLGLLLTLVNVGILVLTWTQVRKPEHAFLRQSVIAVFIYFTVLHVITYAELRFSIPAYAYFLPFAAVALTELLGKPRVDR